MEGNPRAVGGARRLRLPAGPGAIAVCALVALLGAYQAPLFRWGVTAAEPAHGSGLSSGALSSNLGGSAIPDLVRRVAMSVVTLRGAETQGSGVVWSADGIIVTTNHAVDLDGAIEVVFADGVRLPGVVLARSPQTDLAFVKVGRDDLPVARFESELPQVGELVVALGSPLGLENSVAAGIVSGRGRSISLSLPEPMVFAGLLQTDIAIAPGNSGGPLMNLGGAVVGINSARAVAEGAMSISFAIPVSTVRSAIDRLLGESASDLALDRGAQPAPAGSDQLQTHGQ